MRGVYFVHAAEAQGRKVERQGGVLTASRVPVPPLPPGEPKRVRDLHYTVQEILTARWMRDPAPVPLAYGFLNDWSGQGKNQIAVARSRLVQLGVIHQADECQPAGSRRTALFDTGICRHHARKLLWRKPASKEPWRCQGCECPALLRAIEVWTPTHGIIETTQAEYRRAEIEHGERVLAA